MPKCSKNLQIWKHRTSLEWSVLSIMPNVEDAIRMRSFRKLAALLLSKEALGFDW